MADPFLEAGDFFTKAFNAQELASRRQRTAQRAAMRSDDYENQVSEEAPNAPIPPQYGPYGTYEDEFAPSQDPTAGINPSVLGRLFRGVMTEPGSKSKLSSVSASYSAIVSAVIEIRTYLLFCP